MKKIIKVNGMSCAHCQGKVEKALNNIAGVEAKVNLDKKIATVKLNEAVSDEVLSKAVIDAGFSVVGIEEKKGLFGR